MFYGNSLNQIGAQQSFLSSEKLNLSTQENARSMPIPSAVASQLVKAQTAQNATLAAMGRVPQTSLFDYLK